MKFFKKNVDLGHFWYTNLCGSRPPPPTPIQAPRFSYIPAQGGGVRGPYGVLVDRARGADWGFDHTFPWNGVGFYYPLVI